MPRRVVLVFAVLAFCAAAWLLLRRGGAPEVGQGARPSVARPGEGDGKRQGSGLAGSAAPESAANAQKTRPSGRLLAMNRRRADPEGTPRRVEPDEVKKMLRTATEDPDPDERAGAISDITVLDDLSEVLPVLRDAAAHEKDADVRLALLVSLGNLGEQVPLDVLTQFTKDPDPEMRMQALDIVEQLTEDEALGPQMRQLLETATRDPDEDVRDQAQTALDQLDDANDGAEEPYPEAPQEGTPG